MTTTSLNSISLYRSVKNITLLVTAALIFPACGGEQPEQEQAAASQPGPAVEVMNDQLQQLIDPTAELELLGEGYAWSEGPEWVEEYQFLLFSDIPNNVINKWQEGEGVTEYLKPAGYTGDTPRGGEKGSNGLLISNDGHLLLAHHGDRRIARMEVPLDKPAAEFTTLADSYRGNSLNSPNDLVQHSNSDIYFTDPPYGLEDGMEDPAKELSFHGVYRISADGADIELLTDELSRPNGIALSPDETTLYVAVSDPGQAVWMAYDLQEDGSISNGRIFYDATEEVATEPGLPDGMTVDTDGNIYATGPGGIWIFAPDATMLGKIKTGKATSNVAIGNGGSMLYMTADDQLLRIPLL